MTQCRLRKAMWCYLLFSAVVVVTHAQNGPSVNTTQGVIIGANATDGNYYTFYGIHYGGSTSGENRFKAPTPPPVYPGDFHAIDNSIICAQPSQRGLVGVEDCLTLNIFTNNVASPKPVLVWLQGEDYSTTDNRQYSYKTLVESSIVVVTLNYRLSIFGFLCLGIPEAPGNAGLKDVIQGLQWIKQNIAGFGGNPGNVVLFGHGSAAAMVDLITMSPLSENLLHKVIVQSGSALAPWAVAYDPIGYAQLLGSQLSYNGKSRQELGKLLVTTDITVLSSALEKFRFTNNTPLFAPCIEDPNVSPNNTFLTDSPLNILRSGNYSHVPYITGYTNREGTLRASEAALNHWLELMQANFTNFLQADLGFTANQNKTGVVNSIREYYFGQRTINMETINDYLDYHGDTLVLVSVIRGAIERAATSRSEVRLYEFAYRGTRNSDWSFPQIPLNGVPHGGVLNYLLNYDLTPNDESVMRLLVARYVAFIYNGTPSIASNTTWTPFTNSSSNYLYYGGDGATSVAYTPEEIRQNPHTQRMNFWNDLYNTYYKPPTRVSSGDRILGFGFLILFSQFVVRHLL